jgi:hypothetical protein
MQASEMFRADYYELLGIPENATAGQLRSAYRKAAKRWHPDNNPGTNTTGKMQDINEAYLILRDSISRIKYNCELERYREQCRTIRKTMVHYPSPENQASVDSTYEIRDPILKRKVDEARKTAFEMAKTAAVVSVGIAGGVIKVIVIGLVPWIIWFSIVFQQLPTSFGLGVLALGILWLIADGRTKRQ